MAKSIPALINPAVLRWARIFMGFDVKYVAEETNINQIQLEMWESGNSYPSISQIRKLSKLYDFSIAVFYLPEPPNLNRNYPKDRRFLPGMEFLDISPELNVEFRRAEDRREIAVDLMQNIGRRPKSFQEETTISSTPEALANRIRKFLGITIEIQRAWRDDRIAFNTWRSNIEQLDILVFQSSDVPMGQMRGYSMYFDVLPIIGINRKDAYSARCFSILHELVHLMLRTGSLCDIHENERSIISSKDRRIEVFCNNVAGCTLVPKTHLLKEEELETAIYDTDDGDRAINKLSKKYSVSREVIVRRMLNLGLVNESFYFLKRAKYTKQYKPSKAGFVHPVTKALSTAGKPFVGVAIENLNREIITTADFSEYVGIKVKHLDTMRSRFLFY